MWRRVLETASWAAGIASALIAAYLFFAPNLVIITFLPVGNEADRVGTVGVRPRARGLTPLPNPSTLAPQCFRHGI
jgi:hypothetical protein